MPLHWTAGSHLIFNSYERSWSAGLLFYAWPYLFKTYLFKLKLWYNYTCSKACTVQQSTAVVELFAYLYLVTATAELCD